VAAHIKDDHRAAARAFLDGDDDTDLDDVSRGDADDILDLEAIEIIHEEDAQPADTDRAKSEPV
jgi:hypothetical protein